jgi:hypothetical protein
MVSGLIGFDWYQTTLTLNMKMNGYDVRIVFINLTHQNSQYNNQIEQMQLDDRNKTNLYNWWWLFQLLIGAAVCDEDCSCCGRPICCCCGSMDGDGLTSTRHELQSTSCRNIPVMTNSTRNMAKITQLLSNNHITVDITNATVGDILK